MIRNHVFSALILLVTTAMHESIACADGGTSFFAELEKARPVSLATSAKKTDMPGTIKAGQPAVVQFWASWCVSCRPAMEQAIKTIDKSSHPVRFISVSTDEEAGAAKKYLERAGAMTPRLLDATVVDSNQRLAESLKIKAVPTILFVRADGTIAARLAGHPDAAEFERLTKLISQGH